MAFESWIADYDVLTTRCGAVALTDWSQVLLRGSDRVSFLNSMCTNDVRRFEPGQMCEALLLDVKGRIVTQLLVIAGRDELTLLAVPGQVERIIRHLDRYIIRADVQLADGTAEFSWHLVVGPRAEDIKDVAAESTPCDMFWPGGFLVQATKSAAAPWEGLSTVNIASPAWTALRTESFFPLFGVDFDETSLPQEISRDSKTICFTKGCYLGQETVARIDALGHVNKRLVLVKFASESVPVVGTRLAVGGQEVGAVTTATWSPRLECPIGIAVVRRGANDVGSLLGSEYGSGEVIRPVNAVR